MRTITKLFLFICLLFISITMTAQKSVKRYSADIRAGLNFATMDIENANRYKKAHVGVHIGGNFNYKIYGGLQLQTGFYVTKKGLVQEADKEIPSDIPAVMNIQHTKVSSVANYIQVPFNIGYEYFFTRSFAFNINGGLYLAYGFKGYREEEGYLKTYNTEGQPVISISEPKSVNLFTLNKWRRLDYGLNASFGFVYDIYTLNFNLEQGLYNISDNGVDIEGNLSVLKNRNISFSLGFRF